MVLKPTMPEWQTCIHWWSGAQPSLGEFGALTWIRVLWQQPETMGKKYGSLFALLFLTFFIFIA